MRRQLSRQDQPTHDWRTRASCQDLSPDLFFPPGTAGTSWVALGEVRRICGSCPVQEACLRWAISAGVTDGIWGGLTPLERRGHEWSKRGADARRRRGEAPAAG